MNGNGGISVEVRGLERHFGPLKAVAGVDFTFRSGDIFGFVGPNGSGKTTSMRILATIDVPTHGDAVIGGYSVVDDPDKVRPLIGFMPDHLGVYTNLNVAEYLDFFARSYGLGGSQRRAAIESVIQFTELGPLREKKCDVLSKGMRQRLGLARTLIHDPSVLILDEPAAALDPRARIEFRELLLELARRGKAILISSHILTELSEICNAVAIIERGKLLVSGTLDEIRKGLKRSTSLNVRLLRGQEEAAKFLATWPNVGTVRVVGEELEVEYHGSAEEQAELLKMLIDKGHLVTQFHGKEHNLEDIFMQITTGKVQ